MERSGLRLGDSFVRTEERNGENRSKEVVRSVVQVQLDSVAVSFLKYNAVVKDHK